MYTCEQFWDHFLLHRLPMHSTVPQCAGKLEVLGQCEMPPGCCTSTAAAAERSSRCGCVCAWVFICRKCACCNRQLSVRGGLGCTHSILVVLAVLDAAWHSSKLVFNRSTTVVHVTAAFHARQPYSVASDCKLDFSSECGAAAAPCSNFALNQHTLLPNYTCRQAIVASDTWTFCGEESIQAASHPYHRFSLFGSAISQAVMLLML